MGFFKKSRLKKQARRVVSSVFSEPDAISDAAAALKMSGMSQERAADLITAASTGDYSRIDEGAANETQNTMIKMGKLLIDTSISTKMVPSSLYSVLHDDLKELVSLYSVFVAPSDFQSFADQILGALNYWFADSGEAKLTASDLISKRRELGIDDMLNDGAIDGDESALLERYFTRVPMYLFHMRTPYNTDNAGLNDALMKCAFDLFINTAHLVSVLCTEFRPVYYPIFTASYIYHKMLLDEIPSKYVDDIYRSYLQLAEIDMKKYAD